LILTDCFHAKTTQVVFTEFAEELVHWPQKK